MDEIQFDKMEVKTVLAKEYFKQNNYEFSSSKTCLIVSDKDAYGNAIVYDKDSTDFSTEGIRNATLDFIVELEEKLRKLAEEIDKNAERFCQIEYLIRQIPMDEVRNYDIKLIIQNFSRDSCKYPLYDGSSTGFLEYIEMGETTPLANLGLVAQILMYRAHVHILATKNTAAISHLFVELCHNVGLDSVKLSFGKDFNFGTSMDALPVFSSGCIGVVTERSDVDSAIDTFLRTTTRYPWKLRRVLVQESVYESFIKAVSWKAKLKPEEVAAGLTPATNFCAHAFAYDGKTFLVDFAGDAETTSAGILVEAYRTTKELISFVKKHHPLFLSLWASDVSQANEIAYNVPSSVVWINSYGVFDGPPQISQAIYSEIIFSIVPRYLVTEDPLKKLLQRQEVWANMAFEERRAIVKKITEDYLVQLKDDVEMVQHLKKLSNALQNVKSENFASVVNGCICVGLSVPLDILYLNLSIEELLDDIDLIASVLTNGSLVIYGGYRANVDWFEKLFERLSSRIPIASAKRSGFEIDGYFVEKGTTTLARTKVVWTNFGTIFAN